MYNFNLSDKNFKELPGQGYIKVRVLHPKFKNLDSYGKYYDPYYPFIITDINGLYIGKCSRQQLISFLDEPLFQKYINNICGSDEEYYVSKNLLVIKKHKILNLNFYKIDFKFRIFLEKSNQLKTRGLFKRLFDSFIHGDLIFLGYDKN